MISNVKDVSYTVPRTTTSHSSVKTFVSSYPVGYVAISSLSL